VAAGQQEAHSRSSVTAQPHAQDTDKAAAAGVDTSPTSEAVLTEPGQGDPQVVAGFDAAVHVCGRLTTLDWCTGSVVCEERIEHVGQQWSPVRPPVAISAVLYLAESRNRRRNPHEQ
jgi:hypothetical protein